MDQTLRAALDTEDLSIASAAKRQILRADPSHQILWRRPRRYLGYRVYAPWRQLPWRWSGVLRHDYSWTTGHRPKLISRPQVLGGRSELCEANSVWSRTLAWRRRESRIARQYVQCVQSAQPSASPVFRCGHDRDRPELWAFVDRALRESS